MAVQYASRTSSTRHLMDHAMVHIAKWYVPDRISAWSCSNPLCVWCSACIGVGRPLPSSTARRSRCMLWYTSTDSRLGQVSLFENRIYRNDQHKMHLFYILRNWKIDSSNIVTCTNLIKIFALPPGLRKTVPTRGLLIPTSRVQLWESTYFLGIPVRPVQSQATII